MFVRQVNKWSAIELSYLIKYYNFLSMDDLCRDLLKTEILIEDQARKLDLKKIEVISSKTISVSDSLREIFKLKKGYSRVKLRLDLLEKKYGSRVPPPKKKGKYNRGFRGDLGVSVRSGWEANVLRYLTFKRIKWQYEPEVFIFDGIKTGNLSYLPDIYLPNKKTWIEIKGQLRSGDRTKTKRFKKFYPKEFGELQVIVLNESCKAALFYKSIGVPIYAYYRDLRREFRDKLSNWE